MVGLLSPLEVRGLTLKNRIVMPAMYTGLATPRGATTGDLVEHYIKRSKDLGLVIVEHTYVSPNGKLGNRQLGIHDDSLIPELEHLSSSVHSTGAPIVIQITHAGSRTTKEITGMRTVAPSTDLETRAHELSLQELDDLVGDFAEAARRAMKAGFDGVEIHGAHGFLLNQFFSPLSNHRHDKYGGSLENRMRFPLEVVERVRQEVRGRLLLYRLGSDDLDPEGIQIKDSSMFSMKLVEAGVDILNVSGGLCGSRPARFERVQGYFIPQAQQIKRVVQVPVIGVGGITEPEYANGVVAEGKVDLVAVGRELLRDPEWSSKAIGTLRKT